VSVEGGGGESSGRFGAEQGGLCVEELEEGGIAAPLSNRGKKGGRREAGTWHDAWPSSKRRGVWSGTRARERGLAAGSYA
jgi:hypothetical protein